MSKLRRSLNYLIRRHGCTVTALAKEAKVNAGQISRLTRNRRDSDYRLTASVAVRLGNALSVSPRWLMLLSIDDQLARAGWDPPPYGGRRAKA